MTHIHASELEAIEDRFILWAESPEEARIFLSRAAANKFPHKIDLIFVAKKSAKVRANLYVEGLYHQTSNDDQVTVYTELIVAPQSIIDLVQWCTCDVILSLGLKPLAVVEDTTHIVRMNVYQRIPRLYKAAILGVPALVLQGTRGLDFSKRGDCWGMHRYIRAFDAICRIYPQTGALPFVYSPTVEGDEAAAEARMFAYLSSLITGEQTVSAAIRKGMIADLKQIAADGYLGNFAPPINSISVLEETVTVNIGAQPDKKSWAEKGSGQMDPYIGMIAAAKIIYCFDPGGFQNKEMVVRFRFLKPDFWWFKDRLTSKSLYKTLAFEIADRVEFDG